MSDLLSLAGSSTFRRRLAARSKTATLLLGVALGAAFGVFVYSYWLVDWLPSGSRLLLLLAVSGVLAGAAGYVMLLDWAAPRFAALPCKGRTALLLISLLCGAAVLFGGTTAWLAPARSIPFLLPVHHLQVKVTAATGDSHVALAWFNTALGDVSYSALHYSGWKREGDLLVLQDPVHNGLVWAGRTGLTAEMVWRGAADSAIQLSWDGETQDLSLSGGKATYSRQFDVPWYASRVLVLLLGVLVFGSLIAALCLLLWQRRDVLVPTVQEAFAVTSSRSAVIDVLVIGGGMLLALALRLPNLGSHYPAVDEYYHLVAARQILDGAALSSVYQRGLWMVTMPVALSLRLFGYELWAARLPGLLFNVLAVVPLYLLVRKINRPVVVLSIILYATSPWIITFARITREYAYYPFFFFWVIYGMITLLERFPRGFVAWRDWRKLLQWSTVLLALALLIPPLFAFYGDPLSTFRTILFAYLVLGVFLLAQFDFRERSNWPFLGALATGLLVTMAVWYRQQARLLTVPAFNSVPVSYFAPDPAQQWYYGRLVPVIVLAVIGALVSCYLVRRINILPLFICGLFGAYISFFAFLSKTFFHTRHLLTTELWFIILVAVGLYVLWKVARVLIAWQGRLANVLLTAVLALSLTNWQQLAAPILSTNPNDPISEDYLHDMSQVHAYMMSHAQSQDVLISTVYGLYSSWRGEPRFAAQYRMSTETPQDQVIAFINQHGSGWIVIDQIRLGMSTLGPRPFAGNPDVEYIGLFGDENVWHWQHSAGRAGTSAPAGKAE